MKTFKIWSEGYSITGNSSEAMFHGEIDAENFEDACAKLLGDKLDKNRLSIWGCRLFDNELDARKSFG